MWDLIVSVPDHCLSFYFTLLILLRTLLSLLRYLVSLRYSFSYINSITSTEFTHVTYFAIANASGTVPTHFTHVT